MQAETFKDIKGYEWLYRVSNLGNVITVKSGRVLRPGVHTGGYHQVGLCREGVVKTYSVHRLVALAFISNIDKKSDVNHIDGVKTNNSLSNLEWCTRSENIRHSVDVLGNTLMLGKLWVDCPNSKAVIQFSKEWVEIKTYWSTIEAQRETGVWQQNIWKVCLWKLRTAGGYKWSYS